MRYKNATAALPHLIHEVMDKGYDVPSRTGHMTRELTMQHITLTNPLPAEITTPERKVSLPAQIAETMWLLAGRNDVEWLSHYLPRAKDFSDDGETWRGGYGPRIRKWEMGTPDLMPVDQLAHVVQLLKEDPSTRRAVIQIYNPAIDAAPGKDIPCNNWVHLLPRDGKLHAHVAIRSNDLMWGWSGINSFEWTKLLQVVAGLTGLQVGTVTFAISSLHLYEPYWAKAKRILDATEGRELPRYKDQPEFNMGPGWVQKDVTASKVVGELDSLLNRWFLIEGQIRKGGISTALLQQIDSFPEPMFRSWLRVLLSWHHNDPALLPEYLHGTSLEQALHNSPKRKGAEPQKPDHSNQLRTAFTQAVGKLHAEKHQAYGDSWKKRGELMGIMANCARKVDRLGVDGAGDTSADTAIDLQVYLIKYWLWLQKDEHKHPTSGLPHVRRVAEELDNLAQRVPPANDLPLERSVENVKYLFTKLEGLCNDGGFALDKIDMVVQINRALYPLAVRLWMLENPEETWHAGNSTRPFNGYQEN